MRIVAVAIAVFVAALFSATGFMAAALGTEDMLGGGLWGGAAVALAVVGAVIAYKRPAHRVGWLLLSAALFETIAGWSQAYGDYSKGISALPGAVPIGWIGGSLWAVSSTILLVFLPLHFPTGEPPTGRWRWVGWAGALGVVLLLSNTLYVALAHPALMAEEWEIAEAAAIAAGGELLFAVSDAGFPLVMAAGMLAVLSLAVRFVRSRGEERQQVKLLLFAAAVTVSFVIALNVVELPRLVEVLGTAIAMPSIAVATMAAVLRYRLFEIDRVISRTVSYALVTLLLVGVYLSAVTILTAVTAPVTGDTPLAVAAATLSAAAAFGPARRRIQETVDRRFNRARYDARKTVERYAAQLRQEVELHDVEVGLLRTVSTVLEPAGFVVWLRSERASR